MKFFLSTTSKKNMSGAHSDLQALALRAIELTKVDFGIPSTGGRRTAMQQNELYKAGKSKADGLDEIGKHQTGNALDFYAYVDGKASWEKEHLAQIAAAFLQAAGEMRIDIRWGGLFRSFTDMPHVERV